MGAFRATLAGIGLMWLASVALAQRQSVAPTGAPIDLAPLGPPPDALSAPEIMPVRAGELVLVSSTLRLFAFGARDGTPAWKSEPPAGWAELDDAATHALREGIDYRGLLVAPAAGPRVAVAALQIARARKPREEWQGIVTRPQLPERRLFAFELTSGRPLWNHAPPADWDGSAGMLPASQHVTGAPLVVGEIVLVSCTSDASSIDGRVAAYALETGQPLWNTFVVRGQIERNMTGAQPWEFASAPLVASPDGRLVLVQTGLGQVAALALADGAIVWSTSYAPIPLPRTRSYNAPPRQEAWKTSPPIVSGSTVLATPRDANELLALDLASGELRWSVPLEELRKLAPKLALDHLIGERAGVLYLGGGGVAAFTRAGGFRSDGAWQMQWATPVEPTRTRAQLVGERLFVPGASNLLELDPATGAKLASHALAPLRGLLVTDDALFAVEERSFQRLAR